MWGLTLLALASSDICGPAAFKRREHCICGPAAFKRREHCICGPATFKRGAHCICSDNARCVGANCSAEHRQPRGRATSGTSVIYGFNPAHCSNCRCVAIPRKSDSSSVPSMQFPTLAGARILHFVTVVTNSDFVHPLARSVELYGGQRLLVLHLRDMDEIKMASVNDLVRSTVRGEAANPHPLMIDKDIKHWIKGELAFASAKPTHVVVFYLSKKQNCVNS